MLTEINLILDEKAFALSSKDLDIIECMAKEWAESENQRLYGGISSMCVYDLCKRLGIEVPDRLEYMCSDQYEKDMDKLINGR